MSTRVKLSGTMMFPVMSYGSESWALKETNERRIDPLEVWVCRRILRITLRETEKCVCARQMYMTPPTEHVHHEKKDKTILLHDGGLSSLKKLIIEGEINGKRKQRRPQTSWPGDIEKWTWQSRKVLI